MQRPNVIKNICLSYYFGYTEHCRPVTTDGDQTPKQTDPCWMDNHNNLNDKNVHVPKKGLMGPEGFQTCSLSQIKFSTQAEKLAVLFKLSENCSLAWT